MRSCFSLLLFLSSYTTIYLMVPITGIQLVGGPVRITNDFENNLIGTTSSRYKLFPKVFPDGLS